MAQRQGFLIYHSWRPAIETLKPRDAGTLLMALMDYSERGAVPDFKGALLIAFNFCRAKIDSDGQKFSEKCERNAEKARMRWHPTGCNGIQQDTDGCKPCQVNEAKPKVIKKESIEKKAGKPPRPRFVPPSVDEVSAYCTEKGYHVEPSRFVDFYTANGWKQGKGKPIVDWKAAVRTWEQRDKPKETSNGGGYGDVV